MNDARNLGWKLLILQVILAIAAQTLGWITIADNDIYSTNSCQYTLEKKIICNGVDYTNDPQHNHLIQGIECPYLNSEDCAKVQRTVSYVYAPVIGSISIDAQSIIVYFVLLLNLDRKASCTKCYQERCKKCQSVFLRVLFLIWIIAYMIFAILSFLAAQSFNYLADNIKQVTVNQKPFSNFIALGILLLIQMILVSILRNQAIIFLDQVYLQVSQEIPQIHQQGGQSSFGIYPQNDLYAHQYQQNVENELKNTNQNQNAHNQKEIDIQ
ncbi:hypothetical protein pb186bvf_009032 [Paramecium bursaria]